MYNLISKLLTRNWRKIPLVIITFNYNKYKKNGKKGSCNLDVHPLLQTDPHVAEVIYELVDYIRGKYNLDEIR